jgi:hypothetical protein
VITVLITRQAHLTGGVVPQNARYDAWFGVAGTALSKAGISRAAAAKQHMKRLIGFRLSQTLVGVMQILFVATGVACTLMAVSNYTEHRTSPVGEPTRGSLGKATPDRNKND